jgi:Cytochrome P460
MTLPRNLTIALIAGTTALVAAVSVQAQVKPTGEKVAFPENYAQGVLFATLDRADNKQYREFYTSQAAIEAAKRGEPLPNGTVIINVQYAAQLDAQGNPVKDANGRFIKTAARPQAGLCLHLRTAQGCDAIRFSSETLLLQSATDIARPRRRGDRLRAKHSRRLTRVSV